MELIVPLHQLRAKDASFAGGKGAMLGELHHLSSEIAGISVPKGWVITTQAFEQWMQQSGLDDERIAKTLKSVGKNVSDLGLIHEIVKQHTQNYHNNGGMWDQLRPLLTDSMKYAVRSSGIGEDGAGNSFAGQHDSVLNCSIDDILTAIVQVWRSAFEQRALYYRITNSMEEVPIRQAVVIQEMVEPMYAGVAFSADPRTGSREHGLVEYVKGLGEKLVSGKVTPTTIMFQHNEMDKIESPMRRVAEVVLELQQRLGYAADMEWAYDDSLKLLQVRPLTSLPTPLTAAEIEIVSKQSSAYGSVVAMGECLSPGTAKVMGFVTRDQAMEIINLEAQGIRTSVQLKYRALLVPYTTPDDLPILERVAAVVVSRGGITSHAAIVCRELGKPCLKVPSITSLKSRKKGYTQRNMALDGRSGGLYNIDPYEVVK